jgi:copper(I)-binding protein
MSACRMVLCFVLALLAGPVLAHDAKVGDLVIMEPWARATIGQVKTGAAYLTVINRGAAGDRLLAVSTPVAAKAQLHSTIMDAGVMKMRPVEAVDIAANVDGRPKPAEGGGCLCHDADLRDGGKRRRGSPRPGHRRYARV